MKKKTKIIIIVLILLVLLALVFILLSNLGNIIDHFTGGEGPSEEEIKEISQGIEFKREYPDIIKGNWEPSPSHMNKIVKEEVENIKNLGVNTLSVVAEYQFNKDGTPHLSDNENLLIYNIIAAKKEGFAVLLSPNFVGASGHNFAEEGIDIDLEKYLEISKELALKWAEIGEKYQVEYFAPQNEFNGMILNNFADDDQEAAIITTDWHKEMLPELREKFSGRLMAKIDQPHQDIDPKGYDYVGITSSHGNGPLNAVEEDFAKNYALLNEISEKSNVPWLIAEAWFPYGGRYYQARKNHDGLSLDDLQDDYLKMSIDAYKKYLGTDNEPVGYIFIAYLMEGMDIKDREAENILKEFFKEI